MHAPVFGRQYAAKLSFSRVANITPQRTPDMQPIPHTMPV